MPVVSKSSKKTGALPNLIIIGTMKCGTSSLHRYLDLHPEIAMSALKEPNFFVPADNFYSNWDRGIGWYRSLFDPAAQIRGEASVNYSFLPGTAGTAERIAETLGNDVLLVFLVRDPIERAISHYMHACAANREDRPIDVALADLESRYVRRSLFMTQLEPFLEVFGPERIHVDSQDNLLSEREATVQRVFAFLGVDPDFTSPQFDRLWEVSAGKTRKFQMAYRFSRRFGGPERWGAISPRLRWLGERLAFHPTGGGVERPQISDHRRAELADRFRPEVEGLRELSGLEFEGWSL